MTVIHKMLEELIPIAVAAPVVGATRLDPAAGGVVRADDGSNYQVAIAPGALARPATVSIETVAIGDLQAALPPASTGWTVGAAFRLDTGHVPLGAPVQLAVPTALPPGEAVRFYKQDMIPTTEGMRLGWIEVESGIVGADGIARTTSLPYLGLFSEGIYMMLGIGHALEGALSSGAGRLSIAIQELGDVGKAALNLAYAVYTNVGGALMASMGLAGEAFGALQFTVLPQATLTITRVTPKGVLKIATTTVEVAPGAVARREFQYVETSTPASS